MDNMDMTDKIFLAFFYVASFGTGVMLGRMEKQKKENKNQK